MHMFVCVLISQPPSLPPSSCWRGGRQGSERPVSSQNPLLISFVCSSVRERSVQDPAMQGVDLCPSPPNPTPPLSVAPAIHMQATHQPVYSLLSSVHAWPGCCVTSQVQVLGHAGPSRATAGHNGSDPAGSRDQGGVTNVWLLVFWQGSGRNGQTVFRGWAGGHTLGSASPVMFSPVIESAVKPGNVCLSGAPARLRYLKHMKYAQGHRAEINAA